MTTRVALGIVSLTVAACVPQQLPPPVVPEQIMPALPASSAVVPTSPGKGQVTLDADEPSTIVDTIGTTPFVDSDGSTFMAPIDKPVCSATPCVTNLDFGPHQLTFTSNVDGNHYGTGTVQIGQQPVDYRFALGHSDPAPHFASGLALAIAGPTAMFSGMLEYGVTQRSGGFAPTSSWGTAGIISFAIGIAATALGVYLLADPGTAQNGTGVQWTPAS
jgi:hypothetical protein